MSEILLCLPVESKVTLTVKFDSGLTFEMFLFLEQVKTVTTKRSKIFSYSRNLSE